MNLLQYTFFQHALLGSLLASIACGIIGTYIVTRRLVFISRLFRRNRIGTVCRNFPDIVGSRLLRAFRLWCRVAQQT